MRTISRKIKHLVKSPLRGQRGFTLIEVLVVVALLGIMAGIAIPQLNKFITWGDDETQNTELRDVQTAVTALLADTNSATLDTAVTTATADMSEFKVGTATAADYMTNLNGNLVKSGNTYTCTAEGEVSKG